MSLSTEGVSGKVFQRGPVRGGVRLLGFPLLPGKNRFLSKEWDWNCGVRLDFNPSEISVGLERG